MKPARARRSEPSPAPRVVVLAAGAGTRMRSRNPKVLHRVAGRCMIDAVLDAVEPLRPERTIVVLGHGREAVAAHLSGSGRRVAVAVQDPPRGTADAAARALEALGGVAGPVLVLSGDTPLLTTATLARLLAHFAAHSPQACFFSARVERPGSLGRVVRRGRRFVRIVEAREATAAQSAIREVNAGIYCFEGNALARALESLPLHPDTGELYLTDAVAAIARRRGRVDVLELADPREAMGVNSPRELAEADAVERRRGAERLIDQGATLLDPETTLVGPYVTAAPDVVIHPFVVLEGRTTLAEGCEVKSFSDLNDAAVGPRSVVGPFARLRPGTVLEEDVRVGNFVETKKARLKRGVRAAHLSYLGDTEVGERTNIGAGTITCNYDGERKNFTKIGRDAFIGSDTQLVAPVEVGDGAYVGAGSTITKSVPAGALAISRGQQRNIDGWAGRKNKRRA